MTQVQEWPRIAVVGAGAVGGYFGGRLAQAGAPVVMIGRKAFADAVNANGLILHNQRGRERIAVEATTEMSAVRDAALVLFCVKTMATASTAREMSRFLTPGTTVVCLQNGVDNVDQVRAAANIAALPAAVYIAVSVPEPGHIRHLARGDLVVGLASETEKVQKTFVRAGIPCRISSNIEGELWVKLLCNCALNAISALGQARYGQIAASSDARQLMERVVEEVLAVARQARVILPGIEDNESGMAAAMEIANQMSGAFSSTAQDLDRDRATEIDSLNGYISRRGAELGVDVPVNLALFTLVKLAEKRFERAR